MQTEASDRCAPAAYRSGVQQGKCPWSSNGTSRSGVPTAMLSVTKLAPRVLHATPCCAQTHGFDIMIWMPAAVSGITLKCTFNFNNMTPCCCCDSSISVTILMGAVAHRACGLSRAAIVWLSFPHAGRGDAGRVCQKYMLSLRVQGHSFQGAFLPHTSRPRIA